MRTVLLCAGLLLAGTGALAQQNGSVGIGTATPDTAAILELSSPSKALLLPRIADSLLPSAGAKEGMIAFASGSRTYMVYGPGPAEVVTSYMAPTIAVSSVYPQSAVGQIYTAPSTFQLQDFTFQYSGGTSGLTVEVRSGSSPNGAVLATAAVPYTTAPASGSFQSITASFAGSNLTLQAGQSYLFRINTGTGGLYGAYPSGNYGGGFIQTVNGAGIGGNLAFEVRKANPVQWSPLYAPASYAAAGSSYVTLNTPQSIGALKTITSGRLHLASDITGAGGADTLSAGNTLALYAGSNPFYYNPNIVFNIAGTELMRLRRDGGAQNSSSVLQLNGALSLPVSTVTANYTLTASDYTVLVNSTGAVTVTLPAAAAANKGRVYVVSRQGSGAVTVSGAPSGFNSLSSTGPTCITYQSSGAAWIPISKF